MFGKLDESITSNIVFSTTPSDVLDVASFLEKTDQLFVGYVFVHIYRHQRTPYLFDPPRIVGNRKLWVRRQTVGRQHRIVRDDHLIRRDTFDLIDDVRRQLGIRRIQPGYDVGLVGDVQCSVLVRYVTDRGLIRRDDECAVDEHGVGQMLSDRNAQRVEILDVANAGLNGHGHVADLRIESDVFDLADASEQRLHLILGGLRCDVRYLYYFGGRRHGRCVRAGRHREVSANDD